MPPGAVGGLGKAYLCCLAVNRRSLRRRGLWRGWGRAIIGRMLRELRVHLLPALFQPAELCGGLAVVIDLLRASTTIVHALAAGATKVVPCLEVEQARVYAAEHEAEAVVLGGERGGELIEGFDLDNSPLSYTPHRVAGRTVVFTTTNGTRALLRAREADRVLIGAFVNLSAVLRVLEGDERPVHLICAGTRGRFSAEDVLCAGALAAGVAAAAGVEQWDDDAARVAASYFESNAAPGSQRAAIRGSAGGRDLVALGFEADIERAAQWDLFDIVPEFDAAAGIIRGATW